MIPLLVICSLMLGAAAVAMTLRNLIHSALLLTLNWVGIAVFYLWAGAEFVAFAQMLVYVGAVSMIVLSAVLLTRDSRDDDAGAAGKRESWSRATAGIVTAAVVAGVLCGAVISTPFASGPVAERDLSVRRIGELLADRVAGGRVRRRVERRFDRRSAGVGDRCLWQAEAGVGVPGRVDLAQLGERQLGIETLKEMASLWPADPRGPLETYCHTILNSAAFLYVD